MRPCPQLQRRLPQAQTAGCKLSPGLRRACRGASLVCHTAAPAWAEPSPASSSLLDTVDSEFLPSTSSYPSEYVPARDPTRTPPSVKDTGTLRPSAEWYPAWMQYRRREDNYVFWQDKFMRCSLDIPWYEKRWTVFSTFWYILMQFKYFCIPPALRYVFWLGWRAFMFQVYYAHKAMVLWQCKVDAHLARIGSEGRVATFSKAMALRRLHWKNSPAAELLYYLNIYTTGRIHLLPPAAQPTPRPTFFWLF